MSLAKDKVQVCTIPLPVTSSAGMNSLFLGTKHVYLRIGNDTFGTPFTTNRTYNGGSAYLFDGDPLYKNNPKKEKCYSVEALNNQTQDELAKKLKCIAKKMSYNPKKKATGEWFGIFDYDFLQNNCGSMVNFLLECAQAKSTKTFNFGVGDEVQAYKEAKIRSYKKTYYDDETSDYGDICSRAIEECE